MNLLVVRDREEPEEHDEEIVQGVQEEEESSVVVQIKDDMDHEQVDRSLIERGRDENMAVGDRQSEQSEMWDTLFSTFGYTKEVHIDRNSRKRKAQKIENR